MLISCQNCATSYQVDPSSLGASGRSVRCARCKRVWFAANPTAFTQIAEAHRADLTAISGTSAALSSAEPAPEPRADETLIESSPLADDTGTSPQAEWVATTEASPEVTEGFPITSGVDHEDLPLPQQPLPVIAGPALAPTHQGDGAGAADDRVVGEDIETVALRRAKQEASRWRWCWPLGAWPSAVLALIVTNAALIGARAEVVRWVPQTGSLYAAIGLPVNLRGLVFANVTTQKEIQDGVPVLSVEGTIVSAASRATQVPRLRFGLRNQAGQEIYSWTALPDRKALGAGETMTFRSRLATPPPEGRDIVVRFFNRRDLVADIQ
jgi:predicted Zn finger-like uncharacterized protein